MPDLPTVTVTDAQADRILAAYKARFGTTTTAETIEAYKRNLIEQVVNTVLLFESQRLQKQAFADIDAQVQAIKDSLPQPQSPPPPA